MATAARWITLILLSLATALIPSSIATARQSPLQTFDDVMQAVDAIRSAQDAAQKQDRVEQLWETLAASQRIPFVDGENVAFLYRGDARRVLYIGDWTRFQATDSIAAERIEGTDLWVATATFPINARIDYALRFGLTGDPVPDPANPATVTSMLGLPASELAMPGYERPPATIRTEAVPRGTLSENIVIDSSSLGYSVQYRVYLPAGYDEFESLASVYFLDGQWFVAADLGAATIVLDNLIAQGAIAPVVAVFIDSTHMELPAFNRREEQYRGNPDFAAFVADELIPAIDGTYKTAADASSRLLIGASYGGTGVLYIGIQRPDVFRHLAPLSPALFEFRALLDQYRASETLPLDFYVVHGIRQWEPGDISPLLDLLAEKGYAFEFLQDMQGHTFPLWRDALDDVLTHYFPAEADGG